MECLRKALYKSNISDRIKSSGYLLYYGLAKYGESFVLPLLVWAPIIIIIFAILRICISPANNTHSINDILQQIFDSVAAFFQLPRDVSPTSDYYTIINDLNIAERITSAPVLGTAFIALKRRFERLR